uniref:Uncharacterized protein n=1 Tax=Oryza glumipatula TaxID=40148 RepID=A0A0D9Y9D3_9ORYZ
MVDAGEKKAFDMRGGARARHPPPFTPNPIATMDFLHTGGGRNDRNQSREKMAIASLSLHRWPNPCRAEVVEAGARAEEMDATSMRRRMEAATAESRERRMMWP